MSILRKKRIGFVFAMVTMVTLGVFLITPWLWREVKVIRPIILPLVIIKSKSWSGLPVDDILQELGDPRLRSATFIANHRVRDSGPNLFFWANIKLDKDFIGKDSEKFRKLVSENSAVVLDNEKEGSLLEELLKVGNIEDFRDNFQELTLIYEKLKIYEELTYDVGMGEFERGIKVTIGRSRVFERLDVFWKDGL